MNNNTILKDSTYETLIKIPADNLAIKTLKQAIIEVSEGSGSGGSTDLSAYAKKSGLYHDATTPVDLETETQALNTETDALSTRIDTLEAVDMSIYAKKSGLYKDATTAVNLETQCQDIETRVVALETPATQMAMASEQDKNEVAEMVFQKLIKDQDFLNSIIKEVTDRMIAYQYRR
jgi:hypothetical protein